MIFKSANRRIYQIKRLDKYRTGWQNDSALVDIDIFPWSKPEADFRPVTKAGIAACDDSFLVFMETNETEIRAVEKV